MTKIYVTEKSRTGCFNIVNWDFIIVALLIGAVCSTYLHFHPVICIVVAIISGGIAVALMNVKYVGLAVQIICSLFWVAVIYSFLGELFGVGKTTMNSTIWTLFLWIGLTLLFILLHFASLKDINEENDFVITRKSATKKSNDRTSTISPENNDNKEQLVTSFNNAASSLYDTITQAINLTKSGVSSESLYDCMDQSHTSFFKLQTDFKLQISNIENRTSTNEIRQAYINAENIIAEVKNIIQNVLNDMETTKAEHSAKQKAATSNIHEYLFAGCNDDESLKKRYKDLIKLYHPDNPTGDNEMTLSIKATYEKLLADL